VSIQLVEKAWKHTTQGELPEALACHKAILELDPHNDQSLHFTSFILDLQGEHQQALELCKRAISCYGCCADYYATLSAICRHLGDYPQALAAAQTFLQMKPDCATAHSNLAMLLSEGKRHHQALEVYETALEIEPDSAFIHFNRALALLTLGNYQEGFAEYEWRLPLNEGRPIPTYPQNLEGKKVLLVHEQGFGDSIHFCRYAHDLRKLGADVYLDVPRPLHRLFVQCGKTEPIENPDARISMMSLPKLLNMKQPDGKPYLCAIGGRVCDKLPPGNPGNRGNRIGIAFAAPKPFNSQVYVQTTEHGVQILPHPANLAYLSAKKRCVPPELLEPLKSKGDVYIVQKTAHHPDFITLADCFEDFAHTGRALLEMNVIVTIDTAIAHLAGAMGVPTMLLLPYDGEWRRGEGKATPWSACVKIYRQPKRGDWESVIQEVLNDL